MGRSERQARAEALRDGPGNNRDAGADAEPTLGRWSACYPANTPAFTETLARALVWICEQEDGYFKAIGKNEGETIYLIYKFTRGERTEGHYVAVVTNIYALAMHAELLCMKIRAARATGKYLAYDKFENGGG